VRSEDAGETWSELTVPGLVVAYALVPNDPQTLYAGSDGGLYKSTDRGDSWTRLAGHGLPASYAATALAPPLVPRDALAGCPRRRPHRGGLRRHPVPVGRRWRNLNVGLFNRDALTLEFDPGEPGRLLVGTYGAGIFDSRLAP
jgi:hypothetical protein